MDYRLEQIINESENIVFFGGAGVSTESNIPDFRSEKGLYQTREVYGYSPEYILSHEFFMKNTEIFYDYYKNNLVFPKAKPNKAHYALADLEKRGRLKAVITQNIDDLHQQAGSKKVLQLHGTASRNICMNCGKNYPLDYILDDKNCKKGVPHCTCGGTIKPDVVLYGEALDNNLMEEAVSLIEKADTLIIGGTSLVVYPAAGLINYFRGKNLVLINKTPTAFDNRATLAIYDLIGKVFDNENISGK